MYEAVGRFYQDHTLGIDVGVLRNLFRILGVDTQEDRRRGGVCDLEWGGNSAHRYGWNHLLSRAADNDASDWIDHDHRRRGYLEFNRGEPLTNGSCVSLMDAVCAALLSGGAGRAKLAGLNRLG